MSRREVPLSPQLVLVLSGVALVGCLWLALAGASDTLVRSYARRRERYLTTVEQRLSLIFSPETPHGFARRHVLLVAVGALLGGIAAGLPGAIVVAVVATPVPLLVLGAKERERQRQLDLQLPAALVSMANALRTVPTLSYAFEAVAENFKPPIADEFSLLLRQHHIGTSIEAGLSAMARRVRTRRFETVVTALSVGRTTGGELPRILDELAAFFRELERVEGVLDAQTAQGKMQAVLLAAMPVLLGLALFAIDSSLITPLFTHPIGNVILSFAVLLDAGGCLMVRRIVSPEL